MRPELKPTINIRPSKAILFFFNDTATTEIYTLSLHDALPISARRRRIRPRRHGRAHSQSDHRDVRRRDRKSTRLNSSHSQISYAVFCLKKKKIGSVGSTSSSGSSRPFSPTTLARLGLLTAATR